MYSITTIVIIWVIRVNLINIFFKIVLLSMLTIPWLVLGARTIGGYTCRAQLTFASFATKHVGLGRCHGVRCVLRLTNLAKKGFLQTSFEVRESGACLGESEEHFIRQTMRRGGSLSWSWVNLELVATLSLEHTKYST